MTPVIQYGALAASGAPVVLLLVLGVSALAGNPLGEFGIGAATRIALMTALGGALTALVGFVLAGHLPFVLHQGTWFSSSETAFSLDLAIDAMSLGFAVMSLLICNVVAAFSFRYLHRDPGFQRYFVLMAMFVVGIELVALAGSVEVLFVGWELLGLSSALLVGFFHERPAPVGNALRVFAVYRLSDAAMLATAVLLHHWAGSGSLGQLFSVELGADFGLSSGQALAVATLLMVAVAGKSALWPLSGWLPRAMEGPTPSSAVFYGALSIHAGCFLLLRAQAVIAASGVATAMVAIGGLATAAYAAVTGRVQTDVKSAISYATLAQVGIIIVEIALGFRTLAFLHITGHAFFRLLQFLSAPNVLHDLHELDNRLDGQLSRRKGYRPDVRHSLLYFVALERGFADPLLDRFLVHPFRWVVARLDRFDRILVGSPRPGRSR